MEFLELHSLFADDFILLGCQSFHLVINLLCRFSLSMATKRKKKKEERRKK